MEALLLLYLVPMIAAVSLSIAYGGDADSPMGDGMILGLLVLAVPLWPLTMTLWALYMLRRHADLHPGPKPPPN